MTEILLFAGTTEGRRLAEYLAKQDISVCVCAATEYGGSLLPKGESMYISSERWGKEKIESFIKEQGIALVIDATHPFATEVSQNIGAACAHAGAEYLRLLREGAEEIEGGIVVTSVSEAVDYLQQTEGNIFVTTGTKQLNEYTKLKHYEERIYARVLPVRESMEKCYSLGIRGKHLMGMQGPFGEDMNLAMLKAVHARFLVTKEAGTQGGFKEKISAAKKAGVFSIVIGRPKENQGYSYEKMIQILREHYHFPVNQRVTLIGMGMGQADSMTIEAKKALQNSQAVIGAHRMLSSLSLSGQETVELSRPEEIVECIRNHPQWEQIAITFSGDIGCFSGARQLIPLLKKEKSIGEIKSISGISSLVYFMNRLHKTWEDVNIISLHGKKAPVLAAVKRHKKNVIFLGKPNQAAILCALLYEYGLTNVQVTIGENLSYPQERILTGTPQELMELETNALSVALIENDSAENQVATLGIPDQAFIRGTIPMTKEEVRVACLARLGLKRNSVLYDIGAGTGSVAIEAALQMEDGMVYAVERKLEAVRLIQENQKKFAVDNIEVIQAYAPEGLEKLPKPTHAFIGGSGGRLEQIVTYLKLKNPEIHIVITAISLETLGDALSVIKKFPSQNQEIVQITVAKAKEAGEYHMMIGQNPVYMISL